MNLLLARIIPKRRNICFPGRSLFAITRKFSSKFQAAPPVDISKYLPENVRNFCITAHIDHGKTTLSNRLLELTGTIPSDKSHELYLDKLQVEKDRGITVKAQTCSMEFHHNGKSYLLNLIDTPGHVDFNYEVSRSLMACDGALLLVDCAKGVQAQTLANMYLALEAGLEIIPILNKIDLAGANPIQAAKDLKQALGLDNVISISAKSGFNCDKILPAVVERIPAPKASRDAPFKGLLFDSWYDQYHGVICLIYVADGIVKKGDVIKSGNSGNTYDLLGCGILHPTDEEKTALYAGQVGYIKTKMKTTKEAMIGDTFHHVDSVVKLFPGFKPSQPMVFAGLYCTDGEDFNNLREAIEKLTLNDASVTIARESNPALGMGFRCGFLGLLHMDVFKERLDQEFNVKAMATSPSVKYNVKLKSGEVLEIDNPGNFPDSVDIVSSQEPYVKGNIVSPVEYRGNLMKLLSSKRGENIQVDIVDSVRVRISCDLPLSEIIGDFFDQLKAISSGYASFDYAESGYRESALVKLDIKLNGDTVDPLCAVVPSVKAADIGRTLAEKLKEAIPRQQFAIAIQACVGSKVVARETVKPFRKDVLTKGGKTVGGGDVTRKMKLLQKQKEGKKKLKTIGKINLSQEAFYSILNR